MQKNENISIGKNVTFGENVEIGNFVVIHDDTTIGDNVRIDDYAVIGKKPMKALTSATTTQETLPGAVIQSGCLIGTHTVVYRGATVKSDCLIADHATIREHVRIGEKTIVGRAVAVENHCSVGKRCKLETNSYITAYSTLEDYVFVAPGVLTSNDNYLGRTQERFKHFKGIVAKKGARIGVGAVILPGKILGEDCLVAAGSVVTKDVAPKTIVMGSPARPLKKVSEDQLLENQHQKNI